MSLDKAQSFLLNGIQDLTEEEMFAVAGGYGYPGGNDDCDCTCCDEPSSGSSYGAPAPRR